jgi:hypothetical protein
MLKKDLGRQQMEKFVLQGTFLQSLVNTIENNFRNSFCSNKFLEQDSQLHILWTMLGS